MVRDDAAGIVVDATELGRVGSFSYSFDSGAWGWSDEVAAMHGYRPGETMPTTDGLIEHVHPDDRAEVEDAVAEMRATRTGFSSRHRIVDTAGNVHSVAVIGGIFRGRDGAPAGTSGFYLDLDVICDDEEDVVREQVSEHVQEFRENHAPIEQAKGMLMAMYGIDGDRAFDVLRWRSQHENRKLREVARTVVAAAAAMPVPETVRREFDLVVLAPFADAETAGESGAD